MSPPPPQSFPLSGAKLQMHARAGTMRPVRHQPDGQRGTILSPERMPERMPLVASQRGQRTSRRAGGHFINISIYHAVTRPRPCGCPSAHPSANRLGRRPRRSPSTRSALLTVVRSSGCAPRAFGPRQAESIWCSAPDAILPIFSGNAPECQAVPTGGRPNALAACLHQCLPVPPRADAIGRVPGPSTCAAAILAAALSDRDRPGSLDPRTTTLSPDRVRPI
jgi:hypothetical protein